MACSNNSINETKIQPKICKKYKLKDNDRHASPHEQQRTGLKKPKEVRGSKK